MMPVSMAGMKNGLISVRVMSNIKVFTMQDDRSAGRTNTAHYIDPYDIYMDQKLCMIFF